MFLDMTGKKGRAAAFRIYIVDKSQCSALASPDVLPARLAARRLHYMPGFCSRAQRGLEFQVAYSQYAGKPAHGRTGFDLPPVCFEAADTRPIHYFCTSTGGLVVRAVCVQTKAANQ